MPCAFSWLESKWAGFKKKNQEGEQGITGLNEDLLREIGMATTVVPEGFTLHKALKRILKTRAKTVEDGAGASSSSLSPAWIHVLDHTCSPGIDFATAEAMAFGSLMLEGNHVRMSGQDVQRGTFSHRHAMSGETIVCLVWRDVRPEC